MKRQVRMKDDELESLDERFKEASATLKETEEALEESSRYMNKR